MLLIHITVVRSMENKVKKLLISTLATCGISLLCMTANATESSSPILNKTDAKRVFAQSFQNWKAQSELLNATGAGLARVASEYEITMYVNTPDGILAVTPTYTASNLDKPSRIVVSVLQSGAGSLNSRALPDPELRGMIAEAHREMLPEFTVMMKVDLVGEAVQFDHYIFEVGVNPLLDEVASLSKGCWEQCIAR